MREIPRDDRRGDETCSAATHGRLPLRYCQRAIVCAAVKARRIAPPRLSQNPDMRATRPALSMVCSKHQNELLQSSTGFNRAGNSSSHDVSLHFVQQEGRTHRMRPTRPPAAPIRAVGEYQTRKRR